MCRKQNFHRKILSILTVIMFVMFNKFIYLFRNSVDKITNGCYAEFFTACLGA
jgi:hypothetical protein